VIILDHHKTTDDLPICAAHVNPNRLDETEIDDQLHHICACGVVFLTLISCTKLLKESGKEAPDLIKFVPLVAFATICDVMALTPLNRAFVRTGIEFLEKNKTNPSATFNLYSFVDKSGANYRISKITPYTFGFIIGPMVNAGGRSVYLNRNGWAVHTADRSNAAHYELTIVIRRGHAELLSTFDFIEKDPKINF
jgi:single-stranded-DNA-specific exonuclease